jgi:hypothetical protein
MEDSLPFELLIVRSLQAIIVRLNSPHQNLDDALMGNVILGDVSKALAKYEADYNARQSFEDSH